MCRWRTRADGQPHGELARMPQPPSSPRIGTTCPSGSFERAPADARAPTPTPKPNFDAHPIAAPIRSTSSSAGATFWMLPASLRTRGLKIWTSSSVCLWPPASSRECARGSTPRSSSSPAIARACTGARCTSRRCCARTWRGSTSTTRPSSRPRSPRRPRPCSRASGSSSARASSSAFRCSVVSATPSGWTGRCRSCPSSRPRSSVGDSTSSRRSRARPTRS
mmetsp:Transcript_45416/g.125272  ORF Transcript_45416/g.125272 Transcript_45416/m.125272 type:complete len:222 (+) Transcript_45416:333-998(+)